MCSRRKRKKRNERDREKDPKLNCGNGQYNFIAEVGRSFISQRVTYREFVNYRLPPYLTTQKPSCRRSTCSNGKNLSIRLPGGFKQSQKSWVGRSSLLSSWPDFFPPVLGPPPFAFSYCQTISSASYKAKVFYQGGRTVESKEKKSIAADIFLLESLFAIVTQQDNCLRKKFTLTLNFFQFLF